MRVSVWATAMAGVMAAAWPMTVVSAQATTQRTAPPPQVPASSRTGSNDVKDGVDAWGRGDFRKAVEEWRGPAIAGDADAQFNLGQAYKLGRGVPLDPALAESWFRKAAAQGHAQAEDNYGLALFQAGKRGEALPWLEKGVSRGEPRTQLVLGTMLFNGDGVSRDYPRAYALMTLASQKGLKSAGETLAQMDRYVSSQDRERGVALARQYAAQARVAAVDQGPGRTVARADVPPSTVPRPGPGATPPSSVSVAVPAPPARGTPTTAAPAPTRPTAPRPVPVQPTPRPVAQPAPRPATQPAPVRGGNWRVQLGAFRDRGNAEGLWKRIGGKTGGQPAYVAAGGLTRLQATGFADRAAAQRACTASGVACVVVAP